MSARADVPAPLARALSEPVKTHCPYCAFQCGMVVDTTASDRRLDVQADPEFPVNRGQMCIKGFTSAAILDHPERVRSPLVRGRKGKFEEVGWDTALDYVAERIAALRKTHGASAVGTFGSGALTNEKAYLLGKFTRVALESEHIDDNGRYCMASAAAI